MFLHGLGNFVFLLVVYIKLVHLNFGLNYQLMNLLILKWMSVEKAEGIVSGFAGQRWVGGGQRHLGLNRLWTTTLASVPKKESRHVTNLHSRH